MPIIEELKSKYSNQDVWIIGKGPSLEFLVPSDIGDGVVISLNQAILKIEEININNTVFSLQKDPDIAVGKEKRHEWVRPKKGAILLVHKWESDKDGCFVDYSPRYVFDNKKLNLKKFDFSMLSAIKIADLLGCNKKFHFISFDAHAIGVEDTYIPGRGIVDVNEIKQYFSQVNNPRLLIELNKINYEWITPLKK